MDNFTAEITLDKTRHLKFGLRALHIMKQELKTAPADAMVATADQLAILTYACLAWEDKSLTLDKTMDIVDQSGIDLGVLRAKVNEAIGLVAPESKPPLA